MHNINPILRYLFETTITLHKTNQNKLWNSILKKLFFNWEMKKKCYLWFIKKLKNILSDNSKRIVNSN
jgi:hypothetical protein